MMSNEPANNRKYYRLSYPVELMPTVVLNSVEYEVPEISEKGFRIRCGDFQAFRIDEWINGVMTFKDKQAITVSGMVLRHDRSDYVIANVDGISFKRLLIEQRLVINRFIKH